MVLGSIPPSLVWDVRLLRNRLLLLVLVDQDVVSLLKLLIFLLYLVLLKSKLSVHSFFLNILRNAEFCGLGFGTWDTRLFSPAQIIALFCGALVVDDIRIILAIFRTWLLALTWMRFLRLYQFFRWIKLRCLILHDIYLIRIYNLIIIFVVNFLIIINLNLPLFWIWILLNIRVHIDNFLSEYFKFRILAESLPIL